MGSPKLLLEIDGKTIIRRVVDTALASLVFEIVVVLGQYATEIEREVPLGARVRTTFNSGHLEGPHSSLRVGLAALDESTEAAIVLLGDQPSISRGVIDSLIEAHQTYRAPLVVPVYQGKRGHPILFDRTLFPELISASENEGRRSVVARHLESATLVQLATAPPMDVDTPGDYRRLKMETDKFIADRKERPRETAGNEKV